MPEMLPHRTVIFTDYGRLAVKVMRDTRLSPAARVLILALAYRLQLGAGQLSWEEIEAITGYARGTLYWGPAMVARKGGTESPVHQAIKCGYVGWMPGGPNEIGTFKLITDARHQTSDAQHQTSDAQHQTSDAQHQTSDARHQTSDARHQAEMEKPEQTQPATQVVRDVDASTRVGGGKEILRDLGDLRSKGKGAEVPPPVHNPVDNQGSSTTKSSKPAFSGLSPTLLRTWRSKWHEANIPMDQIEATIKVCNTACLQGLPMSAIVGHAKAIEAGYPPGHWPDFVQAKVQLAVKRLQRQPSLWEQSS